jgi:hypothetical protein
VSALAKKSKNTIAAEAVRIIFVAVSATICLRKQRWLPNRGQIAVSQVFNCLALSIILRVVAEPKNKRLKDFAKADHYSQWLVIASQCLDSATKRGMTQSARSLLLGREARIWRKFYNGG